MKDFIPLNKIVLTTFQEEENIRYILRYQFYNLKLFIINIICQRKQFAIQKTALFAWYRKDENGENI